MSELKAMTVLNVQQMGCYDNTLVYFKSEADKVIAEKDEEIYNVKYSRDEWAKACNQKDKEIAQLQAMLEERNKQVGELKSDIADLRDDKKLTDAILDERNAEIAELKEHNENYRFDNKNMLRKITKQDAELRHHKYKRCLKMAELCRAKRDEIIARTPTLILNHPTEYFTRWENRWLELAENFKEAI